MNALEIIYIQDLYPKKIEDTLKSIAPIPETVKWEHQSNEDAQFILPYEL